MFRFGPLKIRANQLKQCFYCGGKLPAKNKEHIFNSCWGGRHRTSQLICNECNLAFAPVDSTFNYITKIIMNALAIKGERHSEVPEIQGAKGLKLKSGAILAKDAPALKVAEKEQGVYQISMEAGSKTEARKVLLDGALEKELSKPLSEKSREDLLKIIRESTPRPGEISEIGIRVALNFQEEYRSAAHTLLKIFGLYEPEFVQHKASEKIRRFARFGEGRWEDFAVKVQQNISPVAMFTRELGNFNSAEIYYSKGEKRIIGVVTILGRVERAIALSEFSGGDGLMFVLERLQGDHLKGFQMVLEQALPPVPLVEVQGSPVTQIDLVDEFGRTAANAVSWDATEAALWNGLGRMIEKNPLLTESVLKDLAECLTNACVRIGRILKSSKTEIQIREILNKGISALKDQFGQPFASEPVQRRIADALVATLQAIDASKP